MMHVDPLSQLWPGERTEETPPCHAEDTGYEVIMGLKRGNNFHCGHAFKCVEQPVIISGVFRPTEYKGLFLQHLPAPAACDTPVNNKPI